MAALTGLAVHGSRRRVTVAPAVQVGESAVCAWTIRRRDL